MALLVYVDDRVLAGNGTHSCDEFKNYLHTCFSIKDLGPLKYFLGIDRGPKGCFLSQCKYAFEIVDECGLLGAKPTNFPMEENHKQALASGSQLNGAGRYQRLMGRMIYLTITRSN